MSPLVLILILLLLFGGAVAITHMDLRAELGSVE
jgi:hypothetical protein